MNTIDCNDYLVEVLKHPCRCEPGLGWTEWYGCTICSGGGKWGIRRDLTRRYAWAIPTDRAIAAIADWSPIIEIGAGTGYWANLIASRHAPLPIVRRAVTLSGTIDLPRGVVVVTYDIRPGHNAWVDADCYHPVAIGNWKMVRRHQDHALMLCWPPMSRLAEKTLRAYRGNRLIYIGEPEGGCCATDRFFAEIAARWREVQTIALPQWWGLHDALWFYERR